VVAGISARIIASAMLIWALAPHAYEYFTLLRLVVCVVAAYLFAQSVDQNKEGWAVLFIGIALLFNPIFPIHLDRRTWNIIDIIVALLLLMSLPFIKTNKLSSEDVETDEYGN
jgi:hypothetical protein